MNEKLRTIESILNALVYDHYETGELYSSYAYALTFEALARVREIRGCEESQNIVRHFEDNSDPNLLPLIHPDDEALKIRIDELTQLRTELRKSQVKRGTLNFARSLYE
jgi:hypothetical protein